MTNTCTYAIGDTHGHLKHLLDLEKQILDHSKKFDKKKIVYLGDYIDRGPQVHDLVEHLVKNPLPDFECHHLLGNHETFLLHAYNNTAGFGYIATWLYHGGIETLKSYGFNKKLLPKSRMDVKTSSFIEIFERNHSDFINEMHMVIPDHHIEFFNNLQYFEFDGKFFFVHAGINPYYPLNSQTEDDLLWIRKPFLQSKIDYGFVVVHGHTISDDVEIKKNRIGCDTGIYETGKLSAVALSDSRVDILQSSIRL